MYSGVMIPGAYFYSESNDEEPRNVDVLHHNGQLIVRSPVGGADDTCTETPLSEMSGKFVPRVTLVLELTGSQVLLTVREPHARMIELSGPRSRRLGDLKLHEIDLEFAAAILEELSGHDDLETSACKALWQASMVLYFKCFGKSDGRGQLDAPKAFNAMPELKSEHVRLAGIRNQHLVHDDGMYSFAAVGVLCSVDPPDAHAILVSAAQAESLTRRNLEHLRTLVARVQEFVATEYAALDKKLIELLKARADLSAATRIEL